MELGTPEILPQAIAGDDLFVTAEEEVAEVSLSGSNSFSPEGELSYQWLDEAGDVLAEGETATVALPIGKYPLTLTVENESGMTDSDRVLVVVEGDRTLLLENFNDGNLDGWTTVTQGENNTDKFVIKGTVASRPDAEEGLPAPQGSLHIFPEDFRQEDIPAGETTDSYLFWNAEDAFTWQDYAIDVTFVSYDDDTVGLLFYYQDENNYYKLEIDAEERFVQLFKLVEGVETTIARSRDRYTSGEEFNLRVDIEDQNIQAYLNGEAVFPYDYEDRDLTEGTVGLYTWNSEGVGFKDLTVYDLSSETTDALEETSEPIFGTLEADPLEIEGSNSLVFAGEGNDLIDASFAEDGNRIYGDGGDDTVILGTGDHVVGAEGADRFFATAGGDNTITGGAGADQFWIANAELPASANVITDFTNGEDVIGIAGLGIGFDDLSISQDGDDALVGNNSHSLI